MILFCIFVILGDMRVFEYLQMLAGSSTEGPRPLPQSWWATRAPCGR